MPASTLIPQLIGLALFLGVGVFLFLRSRSKLTELGSCQPGLDVLRAGFAQSRAADETEPVCVVAYHRTALSMEQVTVGVTNQRVLVVKGGGGLHAFPYDDEGEHLPADEKKQQGRGFFEWSHGSFRDGTKGYSPTVKNHPPFAGEEWRMYPTLQGYPEQAASLKVFARRFYFKWFYD
jgi:hypothetical protein